MATTFIESTFERVKVEIQRYLKSEYSKADIIFFVIQMPFIATKRRK